MRNISLHPKLFVSGGYDDYGRESNPPFDRELGALYNHWTIMPHVCRLDTATVIVLTREMSKYRK